MLTIQKCYSNVPFENWGLTVKNTPKYTFLPNTVKGVQSIVEFAKRKNYRVRCAGYRHSWSSIFAQTNEVFISFVNLHTVTTLPDPMSIVSGEYDASKVPELKTIELREETVPGKKRLCRIGAGVTNEEFRRWSVAGKAWTFPADVILVEVTIGGVNGPICHGAGISHKTLSDYVRRIEYVDCHGKIQVVDDTELLRAAAGAFGLLGVVTHITFELDAMTYAVMQPLKEDVGLGVPPLVKSEIPKALRNKWYEAPDADKQIRKATAEFERRAANDYYSEWFWFSYQKKIWTNSFNVTNDPTGAVNYPDPVNVFLQWVQGWLGGVLTSVPFFNAIPGYWQAQLIASLGMAALPPTLGESKTPTYKTLLPDALHFRRGVQNMRVRDLEVQIPLPPRKDDPTKPDFSIVQRAWWDVINLVYKDADVGADPSSAMRLALEMRIMGSSDMILAPQKGNDLGTLSIEILTLPDAVADDEWNAFAQKVVDLWMSYGGNVRPHWAKEWEQFTFKGQEARKYLKEVAYKDEIPEFRDTLASIGSQHGWTLKELKSRYSNELWDKMVFE
ncbi:FAD-binding domain-containing protein [Amniculicola lignicola CBS 123094]|uniref:FAD-binding domain-containing protein n=1 Tax=Amniculicola lignicola CBS 123094 TaxID=1392246 RepID=A0A6A5WQJ7_9PLEO|nr:FAD-binding domain-containing protein [Amniculicola lignicola CBS 123094]